MYTKFNPETDVLPLVDAKARINDRIEAEEKRRLAILNKCKREALRELNNAFLNGWCMASFIFNSRNCPNKESAISIANELKERFIGAGYQVRIIEQNLINKKDFIIIDVMTK